MIEEIVLIFGIPTKIVSLVMTLYRGTTVLVVTPDEASADFSVNAEVLQGDTLPHYIFFIVVAFVLRNAIKEIAPTCSGW